MHPGDSRYDWVDMYRYRLAWRKAGTFLTGPDKIGEYRFIETIMWEKPGMEGWPGHSGADLARIILSPRAPGVRYSMFFGYARTNSPWCRGLNLDLFVYDHEKKALIVLSPWRITVASDRSAGLSYHALDLVYSLRRARELDDVFKIPGPLKAWAWPLDVTLNMMIKLLRGEAFLQPRDENNITIDFEFGNRPHELALRTPSPASLRDINGPADRGRGRADRADRDLEDDDQSDNNAGGNGAAPAQAKRPEPDDEAGAPAPAPKAHKPDTLKPESP